ncbi:tetratricopeptide repeat protein [Pedobacter helvus]|uniref:Tetratricopeptide repeat protein n=1 Tax=Pedobacter helvus TaxID=2563444 RepID=A0ABW9JIM6_9SPHI|nr:tetratricopeptide repeat protein [Pedobacter ureilyticus]
MIKYTLFALLLNLAIYSHAQENAIATLKFEEAEAAFNSGNYATALNKLDEVDKLAGIMSKSLYLRIVATDIIFDYYDVKSTTLLTLGKYVDSYLKTMEAEGLDDKYRAVYAISGRVNTALQVKKWKESLEFINGEKAGKDKNFEEAIAWLKKGEAKGNLAAINYIGLVYQSQQKYQEAFDHFNKAASAGYATAMRNLAGYYLGGVKGVVAQNYDEAMKWYLKAAENGEADAFDSIGMMYSFGQSVTKNEAEALKWYGRAVNKGQVSAMENMGMLYHFVSESFRDHTKAMFWYRMALERGSKQMENNVGSLYFEGKGVPQNYPEALNWFKKAAANGNIRSANNIGDMYFNGHGSAKNYAEALTWYKKAYESNESEQKQRAKESLGKCYYEMAKEKYLKKDYTSALDDYKSAFSFGNRMARYSIAAMYRDGLGVAKDKKIAKEWENK